MNILTRERRPGNEFQVRRKAPDWTAIRLQEARSRRAGYENFATSVEEAMRRRFERFGHGPSEVHWVGLRAIVKTIEAMALGVAPPKYHLSSLPTGMGKTTALIEATRKLVRIGDETGDPVGILILTNTLDQIPVLIKEMGLKDYQHAVNTGKKGEAQGLNRLGLGKDRASEAQVLFTTQQKLYAMTSLGLTFGTMHGLAYRDGPRAVRIWDECILPAQPRVLWAHDIDRLKSPLLRAGFKDQCDALEVLVSDMKARGAGASIDVPHLQLPDPAHYLGLYDDRDLWIVDALVRMSEGRARIRHDNCAGTVALYYEEILPRGFAPLLILDASGALRLTYSMWKRGRGNLINLPSAGKTYRNLAIGHWDHAAGKTAHRRTIVRRELAEGVAKVVADADPAEPILIIVRLPEKPSANMEQEIRGAVARRMAVEQRSSPPLHFLTWGRHLATNEFADVKHVIVVGLLQYSPAQAEAMARGAGRLGLEKAFSERNIDDFNKGEIAHHIFQAVGRGAIRKAVDGDCPLGCRLDIVFSTKPNGGSVHTPRSLLKRVFPGATIRDWSPAPPPLRINEQKLIAELERVAARSPNGGWATLGQLADVVGIVPVNIWQTLERERVKAELARRGIALERRQGDRRGMRVYRSAAPRPEAEVLDAFKEAKAGAR